MGAEVIGTAIHEAGHAVAFVRLFPARVCGDVSIEPEEGRLGGHIGEELTVCLNTADEQAEAQFEAEAVYCCAGYAAMLAAGYPEEQAIELCESDFVEAGHRLEVGKRKAVELMRRPENRLAVERVAEELLHRKRLDGDHILVLIDVADGETTVEEYHAYLSLRNEPVSL